MSLRNLKSVGHSVAVLGTRSGDGVSDAGHVTAQGPAGTLRVRIGVAFLGSGIDHRKD